MTADEGNIVKFRKTAERPSYGHGDYRKFPIIKGKPVIDTVKHVRNDPIQFAKTPAESIYLKYGKGIIQAQQLQEAKEERERYIGGNIIPKTPYSWQSMQVEKYRQHVAVNSNKQHPSTPEEAPEFKDYSQKKAPRKLRNNTLPGDGGASKNTTDLLQKLITVKEKQDHEEQKQAKADTAVETVKVPGAKINGKRKPQPKVVANKKAKVQRPRVQKRKATVKAKPVPVAKKTKTVETRKPAVRVAKRKQDKDRLVQPIKKVAKVADTRPPAVKVAKRKQDKDRLVQPTRKKVKVLDTRPVAKKGVKRPKLTDTREATVKPETGGMTLRSGKKLTIKKAK